MIEQLEQVKINADNISSVLSRKRSSLRGIKVERKRLLLKQVDDKKKRQAEKKLESKKSPFGKSLKKIKKSTSTNTLFKNVGSNILKFVSLLLLGVALNNLDEIKKALQKTFKVVNDGIKSVSNVIRIIYDSASGFINMFTGRTNNEDDFNNLQKELEEADPLIRQLAIIGQSIKNQLDKLNDATFGNTIDSGMLQDGEKYELKNLYNLDTNQTEPFFKITEPDGSTRLISQSEVNKSFVNEAMENAINIPNFQIETAPNQWWDIGDRYPNKVKYIDVYNPTDDFDANELLELLQKADPKRYSNTIIRVQPVIIDPE